MKKLLFVLFAVWCGAMTAAAQDLIVKTDASQVEARVLEISPDAVRYKRFSNPDGPTYVLPVAEIRYIRYANGEVEYYAKEVPDEPLTPARLRRPRRRVLPRSMCFGAMRSAIYTTATA